MNRQDRRVGNMIKRTTAFLMATILAFPTVALADWESDPQTAAVDTETITEQAGEGESFEESITPQGDPVEEEPIYVTTLGDWTYELAEETNSVILEGYTGLAAGDNVDIEIPATFEIEDKVYDTILAYVNPFWHEEREYSEELLPFEKLNSVVVDQGVKTTDHADEMFAGCTAMTSVDITRLDTSKATTMWAMFRDCESLSEVYMEGCDTSSVTNMAGMFAGCSSLTSLNLAAADTSAVTNMTEMFYRCENLDYLSFENQVQKNFSTQSVQYMAKMFAGCSAIKQLNLGMFDTKKAETMEGMFSGCENLTQLTLGDGFDLGKVMVTTSMFEDCEKLQSIDLGSSKATALTNAESMFCGCSALKTLDITALEGAKLYGMRAMFSCCSSLEELNLYGLDTEHVDDMINLFFNCSSLEEVNLEGWDTGRVRMMNNMFNGCEKLQTIYASDTFVTTGLYSDEELALINDNGEGPFVGYTSSSEAIFFGCAALKAVPERFTAKRKRKTRCMPGSIRDRIPSS